MSTIAALAILRCAVWAVLLWYAIRHRSWESVLVVILAWAGNALLSNGLIVQSGVLGAFQVPLIVYLLIDRLGRNPVHVKHVLASQLHDARDELHDCYADRAAWEAKAVAYKRLLDKKH